VDRQKFWETVESGVAGYGDAIDRLLDEREAIEREVGFLLSDIEAMRVEADDVRDAADTGGGEPESIEDTGHWFGFFATGITDRHSYEMAIEWPNLSLSAAKVKAAIEGEPKPPELTPYERKILERDGLGTLRAKLRHTLRSLQDAEKDDLDGWEYEINTIEDTISSIEDRIKTLVFEICDRQPDYCERCGAENANEEHDPCKGL